MANRDGKLESEKRNGATLTYEFLKNTILNAVWFVISAWRPLYPNAADLPCNAYRIELPNMLAIHVAPGKVVRDT